MLVSAIIFSSLGFLGLYTCYVGTESYLRVYENHIEARAINYLQVLIGGNSSRTSNIVLSFDEIKGVSNSRGTIILKTAK